MRRKTMARAIHLMWGRSDNLTLKDLEWDPAGVKRELVMMLQRAELAPIDMSQTEARPLCLNAPRTSPSHVTFALGATAGCGHGIRARITNSLAASSWFARPTLAL